MKTPKSKGEIRLDHWLGDRLKQGRHSLEQRSQGRRGLGRRLDHDVAADFTANLELREELATSPEEGIAAAVLVAPPGSSNEGVGRGSSGTDTAALSPFETGGAGRVARLVGGFDHLFERVGDLVVKVRVGEVGILVGHVAR